MFSNSFQVESFLGLQSIFFWSNDFLNKCLDKRIQGLQQKKSHKIPMLFMAKNGITPFQVLPSPSLRVRRSTLSSIWSWARSHWCGVWFECRYGRWGSGPRSWGHREGWVSRPAWTSRKVSRARGHGRQPHGTPHFQWCQGMTRSGKTILNFMTFSMW